MSHESLPLSRKKGDMTPRFIYYLLVHSADLIRGIGLGGGAATPILNKSIFSKIRIRIPSRKNWTDIASILSTYDDLIENNRQRIHLLEQMARKLYRKWFVHLRFPGHEHVTINDDIPEGWEHKTLDEISDITMGQSPESIYYNENQDGLPFHQGVTHFGSRFPSHKIYCTVQNRIADKGDILFSVRAPVGRINIATEKIVIGRGIAALRSSRCEQNFLFYALKSHFFKEDMMGGGSIFAAVTKKDLHSVVMLQPSKRVSEQFMERVRPIDRQIEVLHQTIDSLARTRDQLLPRLMNGQIAV